MTALIALGKIGDIVGVLPIAHHHFVTYKKKPVVIVSKEYAALLDRVPFVEAEVYPGHWTDLAGALKFAKRKYSKVSVLSTYGENYPVEHRRSSFQLDAYERAGMLKQWDTLKLEGLARGEAVKFPKPTILFADHSQSSPFLQKDDLFKLLQESFPKHDILRLSEHRVAHLFDFLDWYDAARAIVTVETSHLHLSAATKTPVFALATDKPSRWNGSCWSKRFAFFCRYSEYDSRKAELIEAMRGAFDGRKKAEVVELN